MNRAILDMLEAYPCQSDGDYENALREVFQELALLGLWRGRFFERAAFYGGTALRILHGLDRFSEDMDFSLLAPDASFLLAPYCHHIEKELEAWGFPVQVSVKEKTAHSAIESAFLKAGTLRQLLLIEAPESVLGRVHRNRVLRIKLEIDTQPPPDFESATRFLLRPIPFSVRSYSLPSLFAGKMHALLFRAWGRRVKGRDWYDFVWYVAKGTPLDLRHLSARMRQSGHWTSPDPMTSAEFQERLRHRIDGLDIEAARQDVTPFLKNAASTDVWSREFFLQLAGQVDIFQND
jgi:predicted nucleotidyltransferase component of viral defense system